MKWKIKLGDEARPETVATRFLWAAGYFADEDYYLRDLRVSAELSPDRTLDIQESAAFRRMRHEVLALIRDEERRTEAAELERAS